MHLSVIKCLLKRKGSCVSYLIMELFEEGKFILKRLHLPLQIHSSKSSVIHILQNINITQHCCIEHTCTERTPWRGLCVFTEYLGQAQCPAVCVAPLGCLLTGLPQPALKPWINRGFNTRTVFMLDSCSLSHTHTHTYPDIPALGSRFSHNSLLCQGLLVCWKSNQQRWRFPSTNARNKDIQLWALHATLSRSSNTDPNQNR